MSKQRPSNGTPPAKSTPSAGSPGAKINLTQEYWRRRLFKNSYTREGQRRELAGWSVKIQQAGRRHTFSLPAADRETAALQARKIYESILMQGWDAALSEKAARKKVVSTDESYWKERLMVRRYRFPASGEPENSLAVQINHEGNGYFFPLGTTGLDEAQAGAARIYSTMLKQGWENTCKLFPRELIVAFEWSANPILWTYTTVHTLVGKKAFVPLAPAVPAADLRRVLVVETDAGLRRALMWCLNHQPGFTAVACESPETFSKAFIQHKPSLVLLNRSLAERMGIKFSGGLVPIRDSALALAYSVSVDGDHTFVSVPGGAQGYMLTRIPPANVLDPILFSGKFPVAPFADMLTPVRAFFKERLRPRSNRLTDALAKLTPRENEVLLLLSKGCVDKEIAQAMGISPWTVHGHIKKIFERLNVRTRTEAVVRYLEK
jgi:DNA-binding NarL/FixJ family response regulator